MDALLYTAMNGATRNLWQQQIHSNNLANANTYGFRSDLSQGEGKKVEGKGFESRYLSMIQNGGVDMRPGMVEHTGRDLDIAIQGDGLIAVRDEEGREVYTRNGQMTLTEDGQLKINGYAVMGESGPISLPDYSYIDIGRDGIITIVPEHGNMALAADIDRIKLVDIPVRMLQKNDQGWLVANDVENLEHNEDVRLISQHIESSNVSAINEMTATVSLSRQFEAQIKMMKAAEDLAEAGDSLLRT